MIEVFLWVAGLLVGVIFALIGWIFKMVFNALKDLENDHHKLSDSLSGHKLHAAETYATKVDVNALGDRIIDKLEKIDDKLDKKADKTQ